ncbi:MAG TPA: TRAP transporter substrate-binding protein [Gammaproteobacteria bacterium]|nr:TRAP transporter substrate-binding protein [Gammaproteobacteria bacterium]
MKFSKLFSPAVLLGAILANPLYAADTMELKFGHVGAPGSLFEASANEFARIANERLGGKAKVVTFGSSQLGKDKELLKKLKLGTVDFALPSSVMSSVADEFGLFDMPYLVKDRAHMARIEKEIFWPTLAPIAEKKGYKILAVWENGFRNITNNVRPINVPADLQDLKLRTPKSVWRVKMFKAYGANPTPLSFSEVFVALQTGTFDGQENPLAQIASGKFQEVQKYLSMTGHVYTPAYVTVSTEHFAKLPADVQKILESAAKDTQAFVYRKAEQLEVDLLAELKAGGIQVNVADKQAFVKASAPIYEEFGTTVPDGKALIDKALSLAN